MKGYYKNERATQDAIDEDGWLHTGDMAVMDEYENLFVVDRLKALIKVKGLQVCVLLFYFKPEVNILSLLGSVAGSADLCGRHSILTAV